MPCKSQLLSITSSVITRAAITAVTVIASVGASPAAATPSTYSYSGTLIQPGQTGGSIGEAVSGSFVYDSALGGADALPGDPSAASYLLTVTSFTLSVGAYTNSITATSGGFTDVANDFLNGSFYEDVFSGAGAGNGFFRLDLLSFGPSLPLSPLCQTRCHSTSRFRGRAACSSSRRN